MIEKIDQRELVFLIAKIFEGLKALEDAIIARLEEMEIGLEPDSDSEENVDINFYMEIINLSIENFFIKEIADNFYKEIKSDVKIDEREVEIVVDNIVNTILHVRDVVLSSKDVQRIELLVREYGCFEAGIYPELEIAINNLLKIENFNLLEPAELIRCCFGKEALARTLKIYIKSINNAESDLEFLFQSFMDMLPSNDGDPYPFEEEVRNLIKQKLDEENEEWQLRVDVEINRIAEEIFEIKL